MSMATIRSPVSMWAIRMPWAAVRPPQPGEKTRGATDGSKTSMSQQMYTGRVSNVVEDGSESSIGQLIHCDGAIAEFARQGRRVRQQCRSAQRALRVRCERCAVLHLDAHTDSNPPHPDRPEAATAFWRAHEESLVDTTASFHIGLIIASAIDASPPSTRGTAPPGQLLAIAVWIAASDALWSSRERSMSPASRTSSSRSGPRSLSIRALSGRRWEAARITGGDRCGPKR